MRLDQQGDVWLSDPWVAAFTILAAIALVLWCHVRLSEADSSLRLLSQLGCGAQRRRRDRARHPAEPL